MHSTTLNHWSPETAYLLGYFAADGCMYQNPRGSRYIEFTSTDLSLIECVRRILRASQRISMRKRHPNWRPIYRIQIGSASLVERLKALGFSEKKGARLTMPRVPNRYLSHFIRGYFDGDGSITSGSHRRARGTHYRWCLTRFTSGSRSFLRVLHDTLKQHAHVIGGTIVQKTDSSGYDLQFSAQDTFRLARFLYRDAHPTLSLERKRSAFMRAEQLFARQSSRAW